jgi:UDP-N-acetylglucosamine 2-epimerase
MKISIILGTRSGIMKISPFYLSARSSFIVKAFIINMIEDMNKELEILFWCEVKKRVLINVGGTFDRAEAERKGFYYRGL